MRNTANLLSDRVFYYFEQISKFPRASFNEMQISNYLVDFAKERNLEYYQDEVFNVIIKKPGTSGYENSDTIALQAHIDMVCEKNKDVDHDFLKDSIKTIYEGDFLHADGTTLGADNGIGVAMILAVLDCSDISHAPIEAIFTSSEESGMEGATFLDTTKLKAKMLLNIDSEEEGVFTLGCAGGVKVDINLPLKYKHTKKEFSTYRILISGLLGGHSGIHIDKGRANATKLLVRLLYNLNENFEIELNNIFGGNKDNVITRESEALISFNKNDFESLHAFCKKMQEKFLSEHMTTDEGIKISLIENQFNENAFDKETFQNLINFIYIFPNGVQSMSKTLPNLPESSINIGVLKVCDDKIDVVASIRSSSLSLKEDLINKVKIFVQNSNGNVEFRGSYPAWQYNQNSVLREKCIKIFKELNGIEAKTDIIHAGLECGILSQKLPNLDLISFGPNLYDIHTPNERVSISSVERTWNFLINLLKDIK